MRLFSVFLILLFHSCKKDITPPIIGEITLNSEIDTFRINLDTNNLVVLECAIEDDKDLKQFRIFSSNSLTGSPSDSSLFQNFTYSVNGDFDGNPYFLSREFSIPPTTCTGLYNFNISAIDSEGNEGIGEAVFLWIHSSESPAINVTDPDFVSTPFNAGDTIHFQGSILDNIAIKEIYLDLYNSALSSLDSDVFTYSDTIITSWSFMDNGAKLIIPTVIESGDYLIRVRAIDNDGNLEIEEDNIRID